MGLQLVTISKANHSNKPIVMKTKCNRSGTESFNENRFIPVANDTVVKFYAYLQQFWLTL